MDSPIEHLEQEEFEPCRYCGKREDRDGVLPQRWPSWLHPMHRSCILDLKRWGCD